jgi:hypothetical protein
MRRPEEAVQVAYGSAATILEVGEEEPEDVTKTIGGHGKPR